jgi:2-polyprenyl-3-methyl-5-hydroxy-6-metoxy-1,4-benzoquinol methylase
VITTAPRDQLVDVCGRLRAEYPMIGGGLVDKHLAADDPAWEFAQKALGYVDGLSDSADRTMDAALEAFATVSGDFLRLQARFMRTGQYARAGGAADLVEDLYNDASKMRGYYLDGLALTYALWPNHAKMIEFMARSFLPKLQPGDRVVEVGVGHGLLAALMFERQPDLHYVGVDISDSSLEYAGDALRRSGISTDRVSMVHADAMSGDLERLAGSDGFDAVVCCEVLEHVDTPQDLLSALRGAASAGKPGFISTVANMEAEDHVYLYNDVDEIRAMIKETGWTVAEDLPNVLPGAETWKPLPVNYSAVLTA